MSDRSAVAREALAGDPLVADLLNSPPPQLTTEGAERLLFNAFDITAAATEIACERDQNFRATSAEGRRYVLKITHPAEQRERTVFETLALRRIEQVDPALPVPRVITAVDGQDLVSVPLPDGRTSWVRVLTWVHGMPLYKAQRDADTDRALGRALAQLGRALSDVQHPGGQRDLLWDIRHAARLRPLIAVLEEPQIAQRLNAELDRFEQDVLPRLARLRRQPIHNDLNHHNVMVAADDASQITGIIDFGDMVESHLVIDVAVASSYVADEPEDPLGAVVRLVKAYHAVTPLQRDEVVLLRDLIVMRLATSIAITGWRAQRYPANADYILRNNGPARQALQGFGSLDPARVTETLLHACRLEN